ncbi:MAG TPA: hypothetical protein VFN22_01605 [Gemmatimonadales bacterium]|nr:hypothetical protein [Gemmatimonadales bacterium]
MLPFALLTLVLVEAAAALALSALLSTARLVAERRSTIEAELVLEHVLAEVRVAGDSATAALPPGGGTALPVPAIPGWRATAQARRADTLPLAALTVVVWREDGAGRPLVERRTTLLLSILSADTATMLDNRPRW